MQLSLEKYSRTRWLYIGLVIIGAIFIIRLFYLQVIKHDYYQALALKEQVTQFTIPAKRGLIYARDGNKIVPLVLNKAVYTVYADPKIITDKAKIISTVKKIAGGNVIKDFESGLDNPSSRYAVLARGLSRDQAKLIKQANLVGVGLQEQSERVYPEGSLAAQALGFVDGAGKGQYGVEGSMNKQLSGEPGVLKSVTDVRRIPLTLGNDDIRLPAKDGDNLALTIDRNIQSYVQSALKRGLQTSHATKGSVVVMDPNNGKIMAMANLPSYDPAKYNQVKDYSVFQNKVVSDPYEAGSVMKTLTMGAGLDSGAITTNSTYNNTGAIDVDGVTIKNVEEDPIFPNTTMVDVLHYSLNTGVVWILKQMGGGEVNQTARQTLYDYFHNRYRFGYASGVQQADDQAGIIKSPNEGYGRNVRYANMAFGQGMDVTVLQVAAAFSAAINGGKYYQPNLIAGTVDDTGNLSSTTKPKLVNGNVLSAKNSASLKSLVHQARVLSFLSINDKHGYYIGGKTGTSQIIDPVTGKYSDANSIGSYLGFGGTKKTLRYVIMVRVVDSKIPGYAGTVAAAPIFNDISNWLLDYLAVPPED